MDIPPLPRDVRSNPSDDVQEVSRRLAQAGLTDGHPVVPPTAARVERMLQTWDGAEQLGTLPPLHRRITVEDVAVCAVLAGAPAAALPILVSAAQAIQEPEFNLLGLVTTTGSAAIGVVMHGDVVGDVDANAGSNCLGPGNIANATVGRALSLLVRGGGGLVSGLTDMAITGQPAKYGLAFAELPGRHLWPGLHEDRGCSSSPGAVTVLGPAGTVELVDLSSQTITDLLDTLAAALLLPVAASAEGHTLGSGEPVVVLPPEWVDRLIEAGWDKQRTRRYLWEHALVSLDRLSPGIRDCANAAAISQGYLRVASTPDDITLIVAGGPGTKATLLPLWSGGSRSVTRGIASPAQ